MVLINGLWPPRLALKKVVEGREFLGERWLLVAFGEVEPYLCPVEDTVARPNRIIRQTKTRGPHRPEELVLLHPATQRIEDAGAEVPLHLPGVVVVGALDRLIDPVGDGLLGAALIGVTEGE